MAEYVAKIADSVVARIEEFTGEVQEAIYAQISRLEEDPIKHSRKSMFPYHPKDGSTSIFFADEYGGTRHAITLFFFYGQDEKSLLISKLGHMVVDVPDDDDPYGLRSNPPDD